MCDGCGGTPIAGEDFIFSTYEARLPLSVDQAADADTGLSRGCKTPPMGELFQSFMPAAANLAVVDLRLRAGGSFPGGPDVPMTTCLCFGTRNGPTTR